MGAMLKVAKKNENLIPKVPQRTSVLSWIVRDKTFLSLKRLLLKAWFRSVNHTFVPLIESRGHSFEEYDHNTSEH